MKVAAKLTVVVAGAGACLACVLLAFIYVWLIGREKAEAEAHMQLHATGLAAGLDRFLVERKLEINAIAGDGLISSGQAAPERLAERLIAYRNAGKNFSSIFFLDAGRVRAADTSGLNVGRREPATRCWEEAQKDGLSLGGDVRPAEGLAGPALYICAAVKNKKGAFLGAVAGQLAMNRLVSLLETGQYDPHEGGETDIVNADGIMIYSSDHLKGLLKERAPEWDLLKETLRGGLTGSVIHRYPGAEEALYVFSREPGYLDFKGNGWTVIYDIPTRKVFAQAKKMAADLALVSLALLLLLATAVFLFGRAVARPLARLELAALKIGAGDLDTAVEESADDEIGAAGRALNKMAADLKKTMTSVESLNREIASRGMAEQALRASETKFRGLFSASRDALMTLGPPSWAFTSGNPAAVAMFGAKDEADFIAHGPWMYHRSASPTASSTRKRRRR